MSTSDDQIAEYESQVSELEMLLADSPNDEALIKLKNDLLELIQLTKSDATPDGESAVEQQEDHGGVENQSGKGGLEVDNIESSHGDHDEIQQSDAFSKLSKNSDNTVRPGNNENDATTTTTAAESTTAADAAASTTTKSKKSKSNKKLLSKPFEVPSHLLPLDSDTDAERKRKKRTIKALKSQYKATQKTIETEVKQQSWQDFNSKHKKKTKRKGEGSIFKTEDGIGARVGVISGAVKVMGQERTETSYQQGSKKQRHVF